MAGQRQYTSKGCSLGFLVFFLSLCLIGGFNVISPDNAYAGPKRLQDIEKEKNKDKRIRKFVHPCPGGTEQYGSGPPQGKRVYCRQRMLEGYRKHGTYIGWQRNGEKRVEGDYHLGKKHGKWTAYHLNGQKKYEEEWHNGKRMKKTTYDRDGKAMEERDRRELRNARKEKDRWRYDEDTTRKVRKKRSKSSWVKMSNKGRKRKILRKVKRPKW